MSLSPSCCTSLPVMNRPSAFFKATDLFPSYFCWISNYKLTVFFLQHLKIVVTLSFNPHCFRGNVSSFSHCTSFVCNLSFFLWIFSSLILLLSSFWCAQVRFSLHYIFPPWGSLSFMNLCVDIFHEIWVKWRHFFKYLFCPLFASTSGIAVVCMLDHVILSSDLWDWFFFKKIFPLSFFSLDNLYWFVFKITF